MGRDTPITEALVRPSAQTRDLGFLAPHTQSHAGGPVPTSPVHTPTAPSFKEFVADSPPPPMATRRQQWHMSPRPTPPCSQPPLMEFAKQTSPFFSFFPL